MLKFLVFADSHYKKGMYRTKVSDLEKIMKRAHNEGAEFVVHCGDFANDYKGSPEFLNTYLNNKYDLPVYGVYGNHELESDNTIEFVSAHLCNRPVSFGEPHYDEPVTGYWYADIKNFRLIGLDTNYSYNNESGIGKWEHNMRNRHPEGNHVKDSLAPAQLNWMYDLIKSADAEGKKVIVVSHAAFVPISFEWSPDSEHVQNIFSKFPGTVVLAMNGHYHTDNCLVKDGVCYFDVNSVVNGHWQPSDKPHYKDTDTFEFTDYDADGNPTGTRDFPLNDLSQGFNTWSYSEPLSAIVTIDDDLTITIEGAETSWEYDIKPQGNIYCNTRPEIKNRIIKLK